MPVPKVRTSKSRRNSRRSHLFLRESAASVCPNCQAVKVPHRVCEACGYYRGRQVFTIEVKQQASDEFTQST